MRSDERTAMRLEALIATASYSVQVLIAALANALFLDHGEAVFEHGAH
jgi:hypothetical protein